MAIALMWVSTFAAACRVDDRGRDARPRVELSRMLCDGASPCDEVDRLAPARFVGGQVNLEDCAADQTAVLSGSWSIGDAASRPFEWEAEVRVGGVFPSLRHVAATLACVDEHPQAHSPVVGLAADPDGFAWARLEGDHVFIPFRGNATLGHAFHAKAALDRPDGASAPHVTVSVDGPLSPPAVHGGLARGDGFPWGGERATVVRIIPPQEGLPGAIGWVEIELSSAP